MLPLFFLAIPLLLFFIKKICFRKNSSVTNNPPGPKGLPLIGNLHQLNKSQHLFQQLLQISKKYGPFVYLQLGFVPTLVVSSAEMAKKVLKTQDLAFSGRPSLTGLKNLSYNGLDIGFSPISDYTKELKKICSLHLFSPKMVQSFGHIREKEVMEMIGRIEECACDLKPANLSEITINLTNTIICRIAFGKTYGDDIFEISNFFKLFSEVQAASGGFYFSDYFPYMGLVDILAGKIARRDKSFKELDVFIEKVIREHIDDKRDKSGQADLIDVLLQIQKDPSSTIKLSLEGIKALVLVDIFIAGTDTGATALVWAMSELLKNPKAMKKLQKELRDLHKNKNFLLEDDIKNIPYLQAFVKETMRLHPPVPLLPHATLEQCNINGYIIKPKTWVYVNVYAIGRDPESWDNPEEFLPERFLGSGIDFRGQDFELIPFGSGRRGCPGMLMGIAMVELALANIVYLFDWELPNGMKEGDIDMNVNPGITVHKKVPLCLLPKKYI